MILDSVAVTQLKALTSLAGGVDLEVAVLALAERAVITIPSYLVMQMTIYAGEQSLSVTAWSASARTVVVRSSLRLEIPSNGETSHCHSLVFLAEEYDAFLAFREQWTSEAAGAGALRRIERLVVDGDVPKGMGAGYLIQNFGNDRAADDRGTVERAIGVLMNCGFTVEAARVELDERARLSHWTRGEEAKELLNSLRGTAPSAPDRGPVRP